MVDFKHFKNPVETQYGAMQKNTLYTVDVDKNVLWNLYLDSYEEGTNTIFRTRREYDCSCCRQFIRNVGNVVSIVNGKIQTIWDIDTCAPFQNVANKLSEYVRDAPITDIFLTTERKAGLDKNIEVTENGSEITWQHFFVNIDKKFVRPSNTKVASDKAEIRDRVHVFNRGLREISIDAVDIVLDLIAQNSLYRGAEHKAAVEQFKEHKVKFDKLSEAEKNLYCWTEIVNVPQYVSHIKNNFIGTLLMDISEDKDLENSVKLFESRAYGYMRTTSVISKKQIQDARDKIAAMGLESALERRPAVIADISINDILFVDRDIKPIIGGNVFDDMLKAAPSGNSNRRLDKIEEVTIDQFISDILPKAASLELLFENKHRSNLFGLITAAHPTSGKLFKWDNHFSWTYTGDAADSSIKERVKKAGGTVTGDVRCSLSWTNTDDLDLHMMEPGGYRIYFSNRGRLSPYKGVLDVDMNASGPLVVDPVENITYNSKRTMAPGKYQLIVNQYNKRNSSNFGFVVEIEIDGVIKTYSYDKMMADKANVHVADIEYDGKNFTIKDKISSSEASVTHWGLKTNSFHKVKVAMLSPNYWDSAVGNKHYMFVINECTSDEPLRSFFNEQLRSELYENRKVFEIVGSTLRVEPTPEQLCGLGFSSTQRNSVVCKVSGSFNRVIKINF